MLKHIVCQKVEALFNKAFREGGGENRIFVKTLSKVVPLFSHFIYKVTLT
jgi:hypothetical protein